MTAYAVTAGVGQSGGNQSSMTPFNVTLSPVSFEVRIISIQYAFWNVLQGGGNWGTLGTASMTPEVIRYAGGTASGGATATPAALRQGAASTSVTSRNGTATSVSGGTVSYDSYLPILYVTQGGAATYQFPADFTISPGSVFMFTSGSSLLRAADSGTTSISMQMRIDILFEELRLTWPY